jgi:beta-mannosidase
MTKITDRHGVSDRARKRFGIRTVRLVQHRQADGGTSFYFKVNNKKIFIKGVNWVPLEAMPARVTKRRYEVAVGLVKKQNLNCIRIWGGGYYEDDHLYNLCDQEGILVWQDFMFTCARYPEDKPFLDQVRTEAEYVVKHLRSRACLLIWGGDNEVDFSHTWGVKKRKFDNNKINREVLPEVCRRLSPRIPYIVSSPFSIKDPDPNAAFEGDVHLWHHGTYYDDPVYTGQPWRFVSEIGHLSVPTVSSLKKFIPQKDLWPARNRMWDHHFGSVFSLKAHPERRKKLDQAIRNMLGYVPDCLGEYIRASQEVQAAALCRWIEHARQNKYCGGIIYWNLMDCWPQCSDAVVDYFGEPKKGYFAVAEAFSG